MMQAGSHESRHTGEGIPRQWWEGGIYENEYVKRRRHLEDQGAQLSTGVAWHVRERLGAHAAPGSSRSLPETYPKDPVGPDEIITDPKPVLWPDTDVVPFHYPHPVTGKWVKAD